MSSSVAPGARPSVRYGSSGWAIGGSVPQDAEWRDQPPRLPGPLGLPAPGARPSGVQPEQLRSDVAARPDELEEVVAVHLAQLPGRLGRDRRGSRRLVEQADLAEHLVWAELTQDALVAGSVHLAHGEPAGLDAEEPV